LKNKKQKIAKNLETQPGLPALGRNQLASFTGLGDCSGWNLFASFAPRGSLEGAVIVHSPTKPIMTPRPLHRAVRRTLLRLGNFDALTDAQLLERFAAAKDEAAFEELVRRHGPMVRGICRRLLGPVPDADDAFQAVFIVLLRRTSSPARPNSVGGWLHGVACRVARIARNRSMRRLAREKPMEAAAPAGVAQAGSRPEGAGFDVRPILDEELAHLPERYRAPLVLCYLEGRSVDETAAELGVARGTVASRMSRGRDLLRNRLARRGLALSVAALAAQLESAASVAASAVAIRTLIPAGFGSGAGVREGAAVLAKETLAGMFWGKVRWVGILVAFFVTLGAGTTAVKWAISSDKSETRANPSSVRPADDFSVRWRFNNGKPKDIREIEGKWTHQPGEPGVMLAPDSPVLLVLPTPIPQQPFLLSVKCSERRFAPPPRTGNALWSIGIAAFWANERGDSVDVPGSNGMYRNWINKELEKPGSVNPGERLCWYWMDRWCIMTTSRAPSRINRYAKPYPSQTIALRLKNILVEEIELRSLRPDEVRRMAQIIQNLGKDPGWQSP
jgi:RNA polymerase sigma factor (sigma-70 family)